MVDPLVDPAAAPADELAALERQILADPHAVTLRHAYAQAAGGWRGRFVRLQVELSDLQRAGRKDGELFLACERLAREHGAGWAAPIAPLVHEARFLRGFVEWIVIDAAAFVRDWRELYARAPIRHVDLVDAALVAAELAACEGLAQLRGLSFNLAGTRFGKTRLGSAGARALAASPYLRKLRYLDVRYSDLDEGALAALVTTDALPRLEVGLLDGNAIPDLCEDVSSDWDGTVTDARPTQALYDFTQRHGDRPWLHPVELRRRHVLCEEI
jgi:hypothetical protein